MKRNLCICLISILLQEKLCIAQADSSSFTFSGYVDAYTAYYTDSVGLHNFQKFPTVSPRSGEFGLNIAQLSAKYTGAHARATATIHYGDLPASVWSSDFNMIQEANAGFKLCKTLWLDAGYFRTHVGGEGLYPKENIASSISIGTWFEPYFESGLRLNYTPNDKLVLNIYALNGYNVFVDNNKGKSLGALLTYAFNDHLNIGYNNYAGDDTPEAADSISHFHIYNNAFCNYEINKFKFLASADFCLMENASLEDSSASATMFSALVAARYMVKKNIDVYVRGEIFKDPDGFLSGVYYDKHGVASGLGMMGGTIGVEYKPYENAYIRLEGRDLVADTDQNIFYWNGHNTNTRSELMMNIGVWF